MSALPPAIKGWCPGALRPMPTGDGLLARVRVSAGRLSLDQASGLADCARECGNGAIEISSRGNLQLRGVRDDSLPRLRAGLSRLGLLDADTEVERARNIVASPLSDIDPDAAFDVAPIVAALETRMAFDKASRALPAKFSFVIDAGGRAPLGDVDADVRFEAVGQGFVATLAGSATSEGRLLASRGAPEIAARLAQAFLTLAGRGPDAPRRMRALVGREGAAAVFAAAGLTSQTHVAPRRAISPREVVGPMSFPEQICLGAAPPFGRTDARAFAELAHAARRHGAAGLRLTPWRVLIAIGLDAVRAGRLAEDLAALGFIVAPDDPRLGVVACPGAPACAHAEREAPADAAILAGSLGGAGGVVLHVSGCPKGCARAVPSPLTFVARPEGYDLILDGCAADAPAHRGLSLDQAAALVKTLSRGLAA